MADKADKAPPKTHPRFDHTLVWMTHPDCEEAAIWPRSYLTVNPEWRELKEPDRSPKVQAARSTNPAVVEPATTEEKE